MDVLLDWLALAVIFLTQGMMVAALVVCIALLVIPEHPLIVQCLKFLKGLV